MCVAVVCKSNKKICSELEINNNHKSEKMAIDPTTKPARACRRRSSASSFSSSSSTAKRTRTYVEHNYRDHYNDPIYRPGENEEEDVEAPKRRGPRGGVVVPFPERLYTMLSQVEDDGFEDLVSWQPHGRCFIVHQPKRFVDEVMPKYFRQSKLTSFQRQVNLYGFRRLTAGKDRGAYYHELFLRGRPDLHKKLVRIRVKGTGFKSASSPATEPNFYTYPRCVEGGPKVLDLHVLQGNHVEAAEVESEPEMPPIEPTFQPITSTSLSAAPMPDVPMNPSWKPLSAPPKMMVVTPQLKPIETPTLAKFEDFDTTDASKDASSSGHISLSSMAKDIACHTTICMAYEQEEEPCPITPESNVRQLVTNGLEQAFAMVSPVDSPAPSPFPSMLSLAEAPTSLSYAIPNAVAAPPLPDLVDSRMDCFQDGIQALLASDLGEFRVDQNTLIDSSDLATADYALDPLFLLDDVIGPAHCSLSQENPYCTPWIKSHI